MTIIGLVLVVLIIVGFFLLEYINVKTDEQAQLDIRRLFIYTGIIGFLLSTFFAFFLSTKITQPLLELKKAADSIAEGDYSIRVPYRSNDEMGKLAQTFNQMSHKMEQSIHDLSHEKEQLGSILRSMNDAVITFDADGKVMLANPKGEDMLRFWKEGKGDNASSNSNYIPLPLIDLYKQVVRESKEKTSKIHLTNNAYSVVMTPLYSLNMVRGVVAVFRNITEEEQLEKLRKDFVANVSHELRTPLSMMQGYSEALLDDIASTYEERQELAKVINDESKRMSRLVHDFLDLARMEAGYVEMNFQQLNTTALLERVVRKFQTLAKEQGITLQLDCDDDLPILECADEDRLEQVLTNLIDNAFRHTQSGKNITIWAKSDTLNRKQGVKIAVTDEGAGIDPSDLPYIFERFYKADKARTRASNTGTGLGLSIVRNIIEAHHGTVDIVSEVGKGSTFFFIIPTACPKKIS